MFEDYKYVLFARQGRILRVTLNRPDRLNAIAGEMHREIARLFIDIAADTQSDIVVLTGAGKAFSAGGDIDFLEDCVADPTLFEESVREGKRLISALVDCDKPIICRLNGDAIGLGASIALFCDIIIAADHARIGDPHVRIGLTAGDGGAIIWPQLIGYARAKQYLFTGDLLTAQEASAIGLINFAVPADELDALVDKWAERLAATPSRALRWTKATVNMALKQLTASMIDGSFAYEALSNRTAEHADAIAALRKKQSAARGN